MSIFQRSAKLSVIASHRTGAVSEIKKNQNQKTLATSVGQRLMAVSGRMLGGMLMLSLAATAQADSYTVQIGAYQNFTAEAREQAAALGDLHTQNSGSVTRVMIGQYDSASAARQELAVIKAAGYDDAFVRRYSASGDAHSNNAGQSANAESSSNGGSNSHANDHDEHSHGGHSHRHLATGLQRQLDSLSEEQRANAVILDGKLHIKQGDAFIPL